MTFFKSVFYVSIVSFLALTIFNVYFAWQLYFHSSGMELGALVVIAVLVIGVPINIIFLILLKFFAKYINIQLKDSNTKTKILSLILLISTIIIFLFVVPTLLGTFQTNFSDSKFSFYLDRELGNCRLLVSETQFNPKATRYTSYDNPDLTYTQMLDYCSQSRAYNIKNPPIVTSVNATEFKIGDQIIVHGSNIEGHNIVLENQEKKIYINIPNYSRDVYNSEGQVTFQFLLKDVPYCTTEPVFYTNGNCPKFQNLTPAKYRLYTEGWGMKSNAVDILVK